MAVTYAFALDPEGTEVIGRRRCKHGVLTITGTYTTGGDVVGADVRAMASLFGLTRLDDLEFKDAVTTAGSSPRWDSANRKVVLFEGAAAGSPQAQHGAGDTVTGTIRVVASGK